MVRPRKDDLVPVSFRLERALSDALDRVGGTLAQRFGGGMGPSWNRVDVLRFAIKRLVADVEGGAAFEHTRTPGAVSWGEALIEAHPKLGPALDKAGPLAAEQEDLKGDLGKQDRTQTALILILQGLRRLGIRTGISKD